MATSVSERGMGVSDTGRCVNRLRQTILAIVLTRIGCVIVAEYVSMYDHTDLSIVCDSCYFRLIQLSEREYRTADC